MATNCLIPSLLSDNGPVNVIDTGLVPIIWPNIPAGGAAIVTVSVIDGETGQVPQPGDQVLVAVDKDLQGMTISGAVQSLGFVTVVIMNPTSVAVNLAQVDMRVTVLTNLPTIVSTESIENIVVLNQLIGPVGGTNSYLDGVDASQFVAGTVIQFTLNGPGNGPAQQYQLTPSALPTGPGVVAALNVPSCRWIQIL